MGRSAAIIPVLLLCLACVDTAVPEASRRGRYTLARINGDPLPILFIETSTTRLYFLRGELLLNADDTFSDITDMRVEPTVGTVSFPRDTTRGTYRMVGDTVIFDASQGPGYRMIFQSSGSLVQELVGNTLTYRR
jgi:hypothetical protein